MRARLRSIAPWFVVAACSNGCLFIEPLDEVNEAGAGGEDTGATGGLPSTGGSGAKGGTSGKGGAGGNGGIGRGGSGATGGTGATGGASSGGSSGSSGQGGSGATGGSSKGGTGGSSSGGTAGTDLPPGYVVTGDWHGYAWTTESGADFEDDLTTVPSGDPLCVAGTVHADSTGVGFAMFGFNVAQEADSTEVGAVMPSKFGIIVETANDGGSILRLELVGEDGTVWCTSLNSDSGFYAFNSFKENCWTTGGAAYDREPLRSIGVSVPSNASSDVPFDACLVSVEEAITGPAPPDFTTCAPACDPGLIDDFEGNYGVIYEQAGRAGAWYTYNDMSGGTQELVTHDSPGNGSDHAVHVSGDIFKVWGSGLGVNLNQPAGYLLKQSYDASAYTGVRFAYKSKYPMRFLVHTLATTSIDDAYAEGGTCEPLDDSHCLAFTVEAGAGDGYAYPAASSWTTVDVPFTDLVQPIWSTDPGKAFKRSELVALAFEAPKNENFDYEIDDVTFY